MHYLNPRKRQKWCILEDKFVAIQRLTIRPTFDETVLTFRVLFHLFWQKFWQKLKTDFVYKSFFLFFPRSLVFRNKNHEI